MCINKLCFRGMYRESVNSGFNVPYGHYKKTPIIITKDYLDYISNFIQDVNFICCDYNLSIKNVKKGDFIYLDPPYVPENINSFVGYSVNGFNLGEHHNLFDNIKKLNSKKIKFIMSNSKVKLINDIFKDFKYENIIARRAINSKNPSSTTTEVIIYN